MGTYNKYSINDIQVGDLVYFDDTVHQSNYDEYWEVYGKSAKNGDVNLKLTYLYQEYYWTVHCSDIRQKLAHQILNKTS